MSRGSRGDDSRDHAVSRSSDRTKSGRDAVGATRPLEPLPRSVDRERAPWERTASDRGDVRQPHVAEGRTYHVRDSELRILATTGMFRVVIEGDLVRGANPSTFPGDLRSLAEQRLVERHTITINHRPTRVLVLTAAGRDLLEANRSPDRASQRQAYHAGLVKPRELAHDAQLYRMFRAEEARIAREGGRVTRVLLDYEIKRDYQTFLNRARTTSSDQDARRQAFAQTNGFAVVNGRLEIPDLRIEYELADGRLQHRDVELVTEHYSRGQLAGKSEAGFHLYRAAGATVRSGSTPFDPDYLEWIR